MTLPLMKEPPLLLKNLLSGVDLRSNHFISAIRAYNMMFSFTFMGAIVDNKINDDTAPYVYRISGQNYHRIGSLLPAIGFTPKFAQLYIHDTENEILIRDDVFSSKDKKQNIDNKLIEDLQAMLDSHNVLVQSFRMTRDKLHKDDYNNAKLHLIGGRKQDGRTYNMPTVAKVAGLIVGGVGIAEDGRDIVVESPSGILKRINELHPSYLGLQYPLIFAYGEDGYRIDILLSGSRCKKREKMSMQEYCCFRLFEINDEAKMILMSRKLFQEFFVDVYTMIKIELLSFIRHNQQALRVDLYKGLSDVVLRGETKLASTGKRIILPSSFTGSARFMIQNYQDATTICRWVRYPEFFITFTCNPNWLEIRRFVKKSCVRAEDRPDVVCRVFKIKLNQLVGYIKGEKFFGRFKSVIYTVEFQKCGLPHAHILIFLHNDDKYIIGKDIDKIISAEIPDKNRNKKLFGIVSNFMVHGLCGHGFNHSPCFVNGQCKKNFPKAFYNKIEADDHGYPIYLQRDDGRFIQKRGLNIDNKFIVPYNPELLLQFDAHINVEFCNQSRAIKYLFKYVNKSHDRMTTTFYETSENSYGEKVIDEIKLYYDCKYISLSEAVRRIFGFPISHRESVERLSFHLSDEHTVVLKDDEPIDEVLKKSSQDNSMFIQWMNANKEYPEARELTYVQFPQKFVWKEVEHYDQETNVKTKKKKWCPRLKGMNVGRIFYVHPSAGELYYLRVLLNIIKGATSEDLRTINGVVYATFNEACSAMGLIDDDKEYIDAIEEASF